MKVELLNDGIHGDCGFKRTDVDQTGFVKNKNTRKAERKKRFHDAKNVSGTFFFQCF